MSETNPRLAAFSAELRGLVGSEAGLRPFVCEGDPFDCEAFVIGANPATDGAFWPYWDDHRGFDYGRWRTDYEAGRIRMDKPATSPTRRRLDLIRQAARPVRIVETNAFPRPSPRLAGLGAADRASDILEFLLDRLQPRVILTYAADARAGVAAALHKSGDRPRILESRHLMYVGFTDAERLGTAIRVAVI